METVKMVHIRWQIVLGLKKEVKDLLHFLYICI